MALWGAGGSSSRRSSILCMVCGFFCSFLCQFVPRSVGRAAGDGCLFVCCIRYMKRCFDFCQEVVCVYSLLTHVYVCVFFAAKLAAGCCVRRRKVHCAVPVRFIVLCVNSVCYYSHSRDARSMGHASSQLRLDCCNRITPLVITITQSPVTLRHRYNLFPKQAASTRHCTLHNTNTRCSSDHHRSIQQLSHTCGAQHGPIRRGKESV